MPETAETHLRGGQEVARAQGVCCAALAMIRLGVGLIAGLRRLCHRLAGWKEDDQTWVWKSAYRANTRFNFDLQAP